MSIYYSTAFGEIQATILLRSTKWKTASASPLFEVSKEGQYGRKLMTVHHLGSESSKATRSSGRARRFKVPKALRAYGLGTSKSNQTAPQNITSTHDQPNRDAAIVATAKAAREAHEIAAVAR